jgi:acetyl esterase/lipase
VKFLRVSLLFAGTLWSGIVVAQNPSTSKPPENQAALKSMLSKRIVLTVPGMEKARIQQGIVYKRVGSDELKMDVFSPDKPTASSLPAILFIHGGPLPADFPLPPREWGIYVSYGQYAAASGVIGVTFDYRFFSIERLAEAESDIDDALRYVREHAHALGIDREQIAVWAFSGGGPLLSHFLREPEPGIRCIVGFYSLMDIQPGNMQSPGPSGNSLEHFSPVLALAESNGKLPPIFFGRAGLDNASLNTTIDAFVAEGLKRNVTIDLSNHPEGHHGFDMLDDNARSREIIRRAMDFVKSHF